MESKVNQSNEKYLNAYLYMVEETAEGKTAHIIGLVSSDERVELTEFTFLYVTPSEVAEHKDDLTDYLYERECDNKQYVYDITLDEVAGYYEGAEYMPLSEFTEETPCGLYFD